MDSPENPSISRLMCQQLKQLHPAMAACGGGGPVGAPGMVPGGVPGMVPVGVMPGMVPVGVMGGREPSIGGVMGGREPSIALARETEAEKTKKERSHSPSRLQRAIHSHAPETETDPSKPASQPIPEHLIRREANLHTQSTSSKTATDPHP